MTSAILNFNLVCCVLGGFISFFGLVSYLLKEGFYVTEPLVSLCTGVFLSPYGVDLIRPWEYAGSKEAIATISLCFTRLVLGVQLVIAGVQLPSKYPQLEWRSLAVLLGPIMMTMWIITSLLVWAVVPGLTFVQGLIIGACVTPTDPVLSNSIVKGKFADRNLSKPLQRIIIAESGANDGLGYLFLFLPLYIVKYAGENNQTGKVLTSWIGDTCFYTVFLSVLYGAAAGWVAKIALYWAEKRRLVDRESFHLFVIALALFIIGTVGLLDADDVLACFVAGNTFTWDDWFRRETEGDSLQPIMDLLLNVTVFMWLGAVCPWERFQTNDFVPLETLVLLGVLVLFLRRLPSILILRRFIPQIRHTRHALLTGFFGPIGISAVFYLHVTLEFFKEVQEKHPEKKGLDRLADVTEMVVWFLVVTSVVIHGMSIPIGNMAVRFVRSIRARRPLRAERNETLRSGEGVEATNVDQECRPLLADQNSRSTYTV